MSGERERELRSLPEWIFSDGAMAEGGSGEGMEEGMEEWRGG